MLAFHPDWITGFLFYTFLKTSLVLLYNCATQDDFKAGQQSFDPTVEKPSRLILFSKTLCRSQHPRMATWHRNSIFVAIMMLFCFEREKKNNHTSRSYIISFNSIKALETRHLRKEITCPLWVIIHSWTERSDHYIFSTNVSLKWNF